MMKTFHISDKRNGNLLLSVNCYEKKIYRLLLQQFKKVKGINIREVNNNE